MFRSLVLLWNREQLLVCRSYPLTRSGLAGSGLRILGGYNGIRTLAPLNSEYTSQVVLMPGICCALHVEKSNGQIVFS